MFTYDYAWLDGDFVAYLYVEGVLRCSGMGATRDLARADAFLRYAKRDEIPDVELVEEEVVYLPAATK
jgi:hypothetical protein